MTSDVQLMAIGVLMILDVEREVMVNLTHSQFDDLADKCAEAALNKKGRASVACSAYEVRIGDHLLGREVISVRPNHPTSEFVRINHKPFAHLIIKMDSIVTVERSIS